MSEQSTVSTLNRSGAGRARPGQSLVELVQATWAEILNLGAVRPDDDFFELGGSSLGVASAVARLGEQIGIDLPPRALFEAPTPAEMAELIAERCDPQEQESALETGPVIPGWVIPLQREGADRPVFVFPGSDAGLHILTYEAQVAALVGRDHPFWGFRRDHPDVERLSEVGIAALAGEYARQMRTIQGAGPFLLYASCAGGYLAWETAGKLLAAGEQIAGILFYEVFLRPDFDHVLEGYTPAHISPSWSHSLYYRPQALPVDLTLLMTEEWQTRRWSAPWQHVALESLETVVMHDDASSAQDLAARRQVMLAHHIRDWLEKTEARLQRA